MSRHQHLTRLLLGLLVTVTTGGGVVDAAGAFNSESGKYHVVTVPRTDQLRVDRKVVALQSQTAHQIQPPNPPVIFLHYDYMAAPWWDLSASNFAPDPAAIERVVQA